MRNWQRNNDDEQRREKKNRNFTYFSEEEIRKEGTNRNLEIQWCFLNFFFFSPSVWWNENLMFNDCRDFLLSFFFQNCLLLMSLCLNGNKMSIEWTKIIETFVFKNKTSDSVLNFYQKSIKCLNHPVILGYLAILDQTVCFFFLFQKKVSARMSIFWHSKSNQVIFIKLVITLTAGIMSFLFE